MKGKQFRIKSADKRHFTTRIHWAPMFVTNADIVESLKFYTPEVKAIRHEMCTTPGFEKVATGVRLVEFVGDRNVLPHLFLVCYPDCQESWDLLLTVAGRPPLCLKCKGTGHLRKNCKTPFCRHHQQYGHTSESCSAEKAKQGSYASAARKAGGGIELRQFTDVDFDTDDEETTTGTNIRTATPSRATKDSDETSGQVRSGETAGAELRRPRPVASLTERDTTGVTPQFALL